MMGDSISIIIVLGLLLLPLVLGFFLIRMNRKCKKLKKFEGLINIEEEIQKTKDHSVYEILSLEDKVSTLKNSYSKKKKIYNELEKQISIYTENLELAEVGIYEPKFNFDDSEKYKQNIISVRDIQKEMMSNKSAITCSQDWEVEGSKTKGKAMINRNIRLVARAFNNECDVIISKVKWNNIEKSEERMFRMYDSINKLVESLSIKINKSFLDLKIKELRLTFEYRRKQQEEKEEQAEIRQRIREEAKLEQEILKAQKDEEKYLKLLEKAKHDAEKATGDKLSLLEVKMKELEYELEEAHKKNERAKSMAEQTRAGHVYIISNIGSFGENIYKIGMTRRLEPHDRVKELGDASVPFTFDVHAMIYSDDAPTMEKSLHKYFEDRRVNMVNNRKEFFKVSLTEIKEQALKYKEDVEFIETIEAKEYYETLAILSSIDKEKTSIKNNFPDSL
ncbi:MAG: DUF4041 domain-containing protein [Sulfurovum sp.]|nr:MAG: DUF4041 domain-containing protein [Sulfurovum sp.]